MKRYYSLRLGPNRKCFDSCYRENRISCCCTFPDNKLHLLQYSSFNKDQFLNKFIEVYEISDLAINDKGTTEILAKFTWDIMRKLQLNDLVILSDEYGDYHICEVQGAYDFYFNSFPTHGRPVKWLYNYLNPSNLSDELNAFLTCDRYQIKEVTNNIEEINSLLRRKTNGNWGKKELQIPNESIFSSEKNLENFLIDNWEQTSISHEFDILEKAGRRIGQQFPTDTGPIDILAISKDKKTYCVIELKKDRASDIVVGQISRYMGYIKRKLANNGQEVKGIIIAKEYDRRIQNALAIVPNIEFYKYDITFILQKV